MSEALEQFKIGHFGFSGVHPNDLGASEYTLVTLVCDRSGSTSGFQQEMETSLKEVIKACQMSPRADNLLLRVLTFNQNFKEEHGFKLLEAVNLGDYDGSLPPGGDTSLFDSTLNGIEATANYGAELNKQDYQTNAIVFIVTDGRDNKSAHTANSILEALKAIVENENLESIITVLIGVNVQNPTVAEALKTFKEEAGLTQYVELKDASAKTLAKLAQFISQSISSQSQALGSGGPSKTLQF